MGWAQVKRFLYGVYHNVEPAGVAVVLVAVYPVEVVVVRVLLREPDLVGAHVEGGLRGPAGGLDLYVLSFPVWSEGPKVPCASDLLM